MVRALKTHVVYSLFLYYSSTVLVTFDSLLHYLTSLYTKVLQGLDHCLHRQFC